MGVRNFFIIVSLLSALPSYGSCLRDTLSAFRSTEIGRSIHVQLIAKRASKKAIRDEAALIERYNAGDPHARILIDRLGVRIVENKIVFPKDPLQIFHKINAEVDQLLKNRILNAGEEIRPALVFLRESASLPGEKEWLFVVPGRDPLPPSGFKLYQSSDIDMLIWAQGLAEGKMPVSQSMIDHDLSHITEFLEDPNIMKVTRLYNQKLLQKPGTPEHFKKMNFINSPEMTRYDGRIMITGEYLPLPHFENQKNLKTVLGYWDEQAGKKWINLKENRIRFEKAHMDIDQYVQNLLKNRETLFKRHGGGMRDSYNGARFTVNNPSFSNQIVNHLKKETHWHWDLAERGMTDSLYGMTEEINVLNTMKNNLRAKRGITEGLSDSFRYIRRHEISLKSVDQLLKERINQFQVAYQNASVLKLKAPQVIQDSFLVDEKTYPSTATYRYFKSYLDPKTDDVYYKFFVEWKKPWHQRALKKIKDFAL